MAKPVACSWVFRRANSDSVSLPAFPPGLLKTYERVYQAGWLGILVNSAPSSEELIYARHDRGFALVWLEPGLCDERLGHLLQADAIFERSPRTG